MKIRNIFCSFFFTAFFLLICVVTISKPQEEISLRENRVLNKFKMPTVGSVFNASFQNSFEDAFSDQIIFKEKMYDSYTKLNNVLRNTVRFGNDSDLSLVSISDKGVYSIGADGEWLMEFPWVRTGDLDGLIASRIYNYNDIVRVHPELTFYIYRVENLRDVDWFDEENDFVSAGGYYESLFKRDLDPAIKYQSHAYANLEDYKNYNYKTDHHWNADGAYLGYSNIITMIAADHPEIGEIRIPVEKRESPIHFYGSMAKTSNYNISDDNYDLISDYIYDLPEHRVFVNGEEVSQYGKVNDYLTGNVESTRETNDYREMFGADTFEVVYDYGSNTGLNILVISDSYSNCIEPVLASHFDKTFYIDLRQPRDEEFNLKKYAENNDIDIVLYLGSFFDVFMEQAFSISLY